MSTLSSVPLPNGHQNVSKVPPVKGFFAVSATTSKTCGRGSLEIPNRDHDMHPSVEARILKIKILDSTLL